MLSMLYSHGPLSVAVDATSWQDYMGGIIQHHCYDMYDNHAVQIVGYDTTGMCVSEIRSLTYPRTNQFI